MTHNELAKNVAAAEQALAEAKQALEAFDALPENNVFATMDEAEARIEDALSDQAFQDCQGAGNCGADEYRRDFMVDGKTYTGIYTPEYNRHDKTYYYVDGSDFRVEEKSVV